MRKVSRVCEVKSVLNEVKRVAKPHWSYLYSNQLIYSATLGSFDKSRETRKNALNLQVQGAQDAAEICDPRPRGGALRQVPAALPRPGAAGPAPAAPAQRAAPAAAAAGGVRGALGGAPARGSCDSWDSRAIATCRIT